MNENKYVYRSRIRQLNDRFRQVFSADISILIILCIVAQHSFLIKIAGLGLLIINNPGLFRRVRIRSIPAFYWFLPALEVLKFLILGRDFSPGHLAAFGVGMSYWIASFLVCMVLYDKVTNEPEAVTERSLGFFTVANLLFSLFQFLRICFIEHTVNPFNTGHDHPYGISSGDLINGLFHGVHLTNAFVSLFLVLYYSSRNKYTLTFLALIPLLLTGSNYTTMLLLLCLGIYWLLSRERRTRLSLLIGVVCTLFYIVVTPLNAKYLAEKLSLITFSKPVAGEQYQKSQDSLLNDYLSNPGEHDAAYQELRVVERQINYYINPAFRFDDAVAPGAQDEPLITYDFGKRSGKMTAYRQTWQYLKSSPQHFLLGAGIGGFSSKLAFNFSGIMQSSINKYLPSYQSPVFRENHKSIYAYLKTQHVILHSESNRPFSTYNQLLGEYGVVGLLAFLLLYIWWFFRRIDKRSYALPVMIAMLFMLNLDYLVESLSILFFFECLMFLNMKQRNARAAT